jgi:hypothetical protein
MKAHTQRASVAARRIERLLKLLDEQHHVLVAAGGDKRIILEHRALIQFLKSASTQDLRRIFSTPALSRSLTAPQLTSAQLVEELPETELAHIANSEVEKLIENEKTPRRYLERIAIHRFNVPRGSMRSFSNRRLLIEKLQTLIQNEQTHIAIEEVARRHV